MMNTPIRYVTFEVSTPAKAAELATLAAAAGFGYASVGTDAPREESIYGVPAPEARWAVLETIKALREKGDEGFALIQQLLAKPEYTFVSPKDLEATFGNDASHVLMAGYHVENTTGQFVASRYKGGREEWKELVIEWEHKPTPRFRLSTLAREALAEPTQAAKAA